MWINHEKPTHLQNLLICDSGMSPRISGISICGVLKKFASPPRVFKNVFVTNSLLIEFFPFRP
jgi:hypothetical protein